MLPWWQLDLLGQNVDRSDRKVLNGLSGRKFVCGFALGILYLISEHASRLFEVHGLGVQELAPNRRVHRQRYLFRIIDAASGLHLFA